MVMGSLVVVGPLLLWGELRRNASWQDAVVDAAAAMGAMVPDGLVLLTNMAFLLAAARLAHRGVLTRQLAAVEVLASADTILLDNTGTLTDGTITLIGIVRLPGECADLDDHLIDDVLGALSADPGSSSTLTAIHKAKKAPINWNVVASVEFSSSRRWSAVTFDQHGTWAIGVPEVLLHDDRHHARVDESASQGMRVLVLVRGDSHPSAPTDLEPVALLLLEEQIRPGAPEAIAYLVRQGMTIKVVSGDHPATVAAVARRVGVPHAGHGVRFREMNIAANDQRSAFGRSNSRCRRVRPSVPQREAPHRRRTATRGSCSSPFSGEVVYAALLAVLVGVTARPHPFLPRQLTWTAALTIGIPGLVLAGEHTNRRFRPGYLVRVLRRSIPAAIIATVGLWLCLAVESG